MTVTVVTQLVSQRALPATQGAEVTSVDDLNAGDGRRGRVQPYARQAQDRRFGRGVAVRDRRTPDDPAELRAPAPDPAAARSNPIPVRPGQHGHRGEERAEKLLEDAQIKVSVVASDIFGASGRDMMAALIDGERNPKVLAQLARTSLRRKIPLLEEAFTGRFTDHHAFLLGKMLARIDALEADITEVEGKIEEEITPFRLGGRPAG
ncbi:hypothetical protein ABH927_005498 [Planotetraspora sp. GP83]